MNKVVTTKDVLLKSCVSDGGFVMFKIWNDRETNLTTVNTMYSPF